MRAVLTLMSVAFLSSGCNSACEAVRDELPKAVAASQSFIAQALDQAHPRAARVAALDQLLAQAAFYRDFRGGVERYATARYSRHLSHALLASKVEAQLWTPAAMPDGSGQCVSIRYRALDIPWCYQTHYGCIPHRHHFFDAYCTRVVPPASWDEYRAAEALAADFDGLDSAFELSKQLRRSNGADAIDLYDVTALLQSIAERLKVASAAAEPAVAKVCPTVTD